MGWGLAALDKPTSEEIAAAKAAKAAKKKAEADRLAAIAAAELQANPTHDAMLATHALKQVQRGAN